jgi:hypothetical protein
VSDFTPDVTGLLGRGGLYFSAPTGQLTGRPREPVPDSQREGRSLSFAQALTMRKEVYATTGARLLGRVFGGYEFDAADLGRTDFAGYGYKAGYRWVVM